MPAVTAANTAGQPYSRTVPQLAIRTNVEGSAGHIPASFRNSSAIDDGSSSLDLHKEVSRWALKVAQQGMTQPPFFVHVRRVVHVSRSLLPAPFKLVLGARKFVGGKHTCESFRRFR